HPPSSVSSSPPRSCDGTEKIERPENAPPAAAAMTAHVTGTQPMTPATKPATPSTPIHVVRRPQRALSVRSGRVWARTPTDPKGTTNRIQAEETLGCIVATVAIRRDIGTCRDPRNPERG